MAQRTGVVIYTISTSTDWLTSEDSSDPNKNAERKYQKVGGDLVLQALADTSGGRAFFPYRVDDLNQSFLDIGDELRSQYSIAWAPTDAKPTQISHHKNSSGPKGPNHSRQSRLLRCPADPPQGRRDSSDCCLSTSPSPGPPPAAAPPRR